MSTSNTPSTFASVLRFLPAMLWMTVIFVISDQPTVPQLPGMMSSVTSVIGHFTVNFVLAILLWWAMAPFGLTSRQRFLLAFAVAVLCGISDEWHQSFVPGRYPSFFDVATDAIGAATGLIAIHLAARSRTFGSLIHR